MLVHEGAHLRRGARSTSGLSARSVIRESLHVLESGSQVQNAIYLAGGTEWPVSAEDWEAAAREKLEQGPFDYVAGGAGSEATIRANREAFERRRLRPRMLDRQRRARPLGRGARAAFAGTVPARTGRRPLDRASGSGARRRPRLEGDRRADDPLERRLDLARRRRRGARRRAALVPALLVGRPRARRQPRRPRGRSRIRRDRRHARHADSRLARPRPPQRLPALPLRRRGSRSSSATRSSASGSTRRPRRTSRPRR